MKRFSLVLDKVFREIGSRKQGGKTMGRIALKTIWCLMGLLLFSFSAEAATYVQDVGSTLAFVKRSDNGNWQDVLGPGSFETYGYEYAQTDNNLQIKIFTNYPQAGYTVGNGVSWHTSPGDFMLDVNLDGTYEYALALVGHDDASNPDGINDGTVTAGQLYQIANSYLASNYMPAGFTGEYGTDWRFESSPGITHPAYVRANGSNIIGTAGVSWYTYPTPSPDYGVTLNLDVTDFLPSGFNGDIGVYWSTATCSNDVIAGNMSVYNTSYNNPPDEEDDEEDDPEDSSTPEPSTWFMLGSGLLGVFGFNLRRKKQTELI